MSLPNELVMPGDGATNPYTVPGTTRKYSATAHTPAVAATAYFTLDDTTSNFEAGDTVQVANHTFTFVTPIGITAGNVLLGATQAESIANLIVAVNWGPGSTIKYVKTSTANTCTAAKVGQGILFTAVTAGTAGNSLASVYTPATSGADIGAFGDTTFDGGAAAVAGAAISVNGDDARRLCSVGWVGLLGAKTDLGSGTTANRPTNALKGQCYNDTDVGAVVIYGGSTTGWLHATTGAGA